MERVIDVVKVIGKCGLSYRGHRHEAVHNLENMFLKLILFVKQI